MMLPVAVLRNKAFPFVVRLLICLLIARLFGETIVGWVRTYQLSNNYSYRSKSKHPFLRGKIENQKNKRRYLTTIPPALPPWALLAASEQNRLGSLRRACQQYQLGQWKNDTSASHTNLTEAQMRGYKMYPPKAKYYNLLVNQENQLTYCPIPKVATDYLHRKLLLLTRRYNLEPSRYVRDSPETLLRHFVPHIHPWDSYPLKLKNSTSFLFVRHPFERLVAVYRDKFENALDEHYFMQYGRKMINLYRKALVQQKGPTFEEFVKFLLNRGSSMPLNDMWTPYFLHCTPCDVPYSMVGKFETFNWDTEYLGKIASFNNTKVWGTEFFGYGTNLNVSKTYFSELLKSQVQGLYDIYWLDFKLFDYSHAEYLAFAKDGEDSPQQDEPSVS